MRTTIRLDDALLRDAKSIAAKAGRSLNDFIADAVQAAIRSSSQPTGSVEIPVFRGGRGVHAGVNLDSNAALLDLMDVGSRHT